MSRKHINNYPQKYYIFCFSAILCIFLYACNVTQKVPDGQYLLTKNNFEFTDGKVHADEVEGMVAQKPNKKTLLIAPLGLIAYNFANPKYDTILKEYMTYPNEMRNQKLRDSLFVKYNHPEYIGKSLFWNRFWHTTGSSPVIYSDAKTKQSARSIENKLVNHGYWDTKVSTGVKKDSANKKAQASYIITHNSPTFIKDYFYNIPDETVKFYFERDVQKSLVKKGEILDETVLEKEITRINDLMKEEGYYKFNNDNQDIYFVADTLQSRKDVPLTMHIHKDSANSPYKKATFGKIEVAVADNIADVDKLPLRDSLRGINIYRKDSAYKVNSLWLPIVLKPGELYNQDKLDLTRRNLTSMNNFSIIRAADNLREKGPGRDSIIDVQYVLRPLPKYDFNIATDIHYSQILNFGFSPSVDITNRNIFGGAENLITSFSGIVGTVNDPVEENPLFNAYELSAQISLLFPRLVVPFKNYWKLVPKKYSPTTSINLGASIQNNIGLGRVNFNTGLNFFANVSDRVQHKLTLFNTQVSLTRNKNRYYEYFPAEDQIRARIFQEYIDAYPGTDFSGIPYDEVISFILFDTDFVESLTQKDPNLMNSFLQSLFNQERQTQDVIISSLIYNYTYNEIGKKDYLNPFYFNGKVELAGNFLNLVTKKSEEYIINGDTKTIFGIPFSQFIKFDFDFRKYWTIFPYKKRPHTLAIRQLIGVGIPYGNSSTMPYVRSYFNGGSYDIRAWIAFGGLGPADSQLDEKVRSFATDNVKLTTSVEYRMPLSDTFEGALFTDAGNIWGLEDNGFGDEFKFNKFVSQMGVGSGFGIRMNIAYIKLRLDLAYKVHDPNRPKGDRWVIDKIQPLKPTINFGFNYPF